MNFEKITKYLDSLPETYGLPSVDVIIMKDHEQVYRHMAGTTDTEHKKPVDEKAQYLVFSMTKIQTMTALMQLVERGKVSLDDEVAKYLPAYGKLFVAERFEDQLRIVPAKRPMLIRHLVSMQSGLDYDLGREGIAYALRKYGPDATTRQIVESFPLTPLVFHPGDSFLYSLSHDVVAAIIEVVSGMKFSEYLTEHIWKPLGMNRTRFFMKEGQEKDLAQQFIWEDEKIVPMENDCNYRLSDAYESGGAGLVSCTEDYAVLADALACGGVAKNGYRVLTEESIETIRTDLLSERGHEEIEKNMGRVGYGYGVGMQVLLDPEAIGSPAKAGVFGWDGAAGSCTIMSPETRTSLVFSMHVRSFGPAYGEIHPRLRDLLFED
ncbi:MAG: beta-lactamase family protein [Lachnospiraceae bacterium]|nr:beta-lactamase family protein [Lachnospiraceae bacterium]